MHPGLDRILHFPLKQCAARNGDGSSHAAKHQILRLSSPDASLEVCIFALKIGPEKTHQIHIFVSQLPHERCRHSLQLTEGKLSSKDTFTFLTKELDVPHTAHSSQPTGSRNRGFTLIELLVGMAIGVTSATILCLTPVISHADQKYLDQVMEQLNHYLWCSRQLMHIHPLAAALKDI